MATTLDYVVIGASGLVGSAICRSLRGGGKSVGGVARWGDQGVRADLHRLGVQTIHFDALKDDPACLPAARTVILEVWDRRDLAATDTCERIWALNFDAIGRIALRYAGTADFLNGSTGGVYGPHLHPRSENDPCKPDTDYGRARLAQERLLTLLCVKYGSRIAHLRYYYSNSQRSGVIRDLAEAILAGESLGDSPDERLQVIGREDFIRCTLEAEGRLAKEPLIVNVCHPRVWSKRQLAERIIAELGRGQVMFNADSGGAEHSYTGATKKMVDLFGPPREDLDAIIALVAHTVAAQQPV
jgi:nucleoside-diphosphate-sugar epimerase